MPSVIATAPVKSMRKPAPAAPISLHFYTTLELEDLQSTGCDSRVRCSHLQLHLCLRLIKVSERGWFQLNVNSHAVSLSTFTALN